MLRSNCKKALENLRKYILDNSCYEDEEPPKNWREGCALIWKDFRRCCPAPRGSWQDEFVNWLAGLPSCGIGDFFYGRSAKADLMAILEETEEEAARFSEEDAERMLGILLFREISKADMKYREGGK